LAISAKNLEKSLELPEKVGQGSQQNYLQGRIKGGGKRRGSRNGGVDKLQNHGCTNKHPKAKRVEQNPLRKKTGVHSGEEDEDRFLLKSSTVRSTAYECRSATGGYPSVSFTEVSKEMTKKREPREKGKLATKGGGAQGSSR